MPLRRWAYRLRQGLVRLAVSLCPGLLNEAPARQLLSGQAWALYARMGPGDRAHALCVLARLEPQQPAPWLAEAALLHDVGKAEGHLSLLYRALVVLLGPRLPRWASADPASWRYPFHVHLQHARRGAELCAQAGCDPRVVALVRWHDSPPARVPNPALRRALAALQAADDQC
jgi:hypothetical protein